MYTQVAPLSVTLSRGTERSRGRTALGGVGTAFFADLVASGSARPGASRYGGAQQGKKAYKHETWTPDVSSGLSSFSAAPNERAAEWRFQGSTWIWEKPSLRLARGLFKARQAPTSSTKVTSPWAYSRARGRRGMFCHTLGGRPTFTDATRPNCSNNFFSRHSVVPGGSPHTASVHMVRGFTCSNLIWWPRIHVRSPSLSCASPSFIRRSQIPRKEVISNGPPNTRSRSCFLTRSSGGRPATASCAAISFRYPATTLPLPDFYALQHTDGGEGGACQGQGACQGTCFWLPTICGDQAQSASARKQRS